MKIGLASMSRSNQHAKSTQEKELKKNPHKTMLVNEITQDEARTKNEQFTKIILLNEEK
jgi:hypothetical protein